jgi:hypothetical protein
VAKIQNENWLDFDARSADMMRSVGSSEGPRTPRAAGAQDGHGHDVAKAIKNQGR